MWLEHPYESSHPGWYALQVAIIAGSAVAGAVAAMLSPRRAYVVPVWLVALSLLNTFFEQFPSPLSWTVELIWVAGPCLGLLIGWFLGMHRRGA